jgi:hypothetical protein
MKNHTSNEKKKVRSLAFTTKFGAVVYFPDSKEGLTFIATAEGERRVRGAEKRILLSMLGAIEEARRRPLPVAGQN